MTAAGQLTLGLLESAPDRQTAQLLALAAVHQGVGADTVRAAWDRWQHTHTPKGGAR